MTFSLGTAVGYLVLNARQVSQGVQQAINAISRLPGSLTKTNSQMKDVYRDNFFALRDMSTGFGAVAVAAATGFGLAAKAAIDWETAMAGVERTTYDAQLSTEQNSQALGVLEDQLLGLASRKPIRTTDLAAIAEEAGALGLRSTEIAGFTSVIADMEAATNIAGDVATTALARIGNIMGATTSDYERMGSATVELGRSTAATEGEIVTMARRIAGAGKTVGISTDEVLAFAAAMASVGIREEQGGSGISRTFIDIQNAVTKGGRELELFAAVSGKSVDQFKQAFKDDAAGATTAFINGLGKMQKSGRDVFAVLNELGIIEVRQRDVLLRLASAGDLLNKTLDIGADAFGKNTALAEIAERRYGTTAAQLKMLGNQAFEVGVQVGEGLLPAIKLVVGMLSALAAGLQGIPGPLRTGLALLVALGGVLTGLVAVFGFLVPRINAAIIALEAMAGTSYRVGAAVSFMQKSLKAIGIILSLATIAISVFGRKQKEAANEAERLAAAQQEVADHVADLRKGNDNAVKGWALQKAAVSGLDAELASIGVSMQTFLDAVTGGPNSQAMNSFITSWTNAFNNFQQQQIAAGATSEEAIESATEKYRPLLSAVEDYVNAVNSEKIRQDALNNSMKQNGVVSEEMAQNLQKLSEAREEEIEKIDKMNQAQLDLVDAQRAQRSAQLGLADAQQKFLEAQRELTQIGALIQQQQDKITAARLDEQSAVIDLAEAQRELARARTEAAQDVREAELDLADAEASRIDSQLRVLDLQEKLAEASIGPTVDDMRAAVNKLNKALLSLRHAQVSVADAQWQINYLMEEGASARDIADAQLALADAQQEVADSEQGIAEARNELSELTDPIKRAERLAEIQRDLAQAQRDVERSTISLTDAQQNLNDARFAAASDTAYRDALADVARAEIAVRDGAIRVQEEIAKMQSLQSGELERAFQRAQLDLEDAYYRLAVANVEVQKQMALARGETWTVERQVAALRAELIRLGQEAGPISASVSGNLDSMGRSLIANTPPRHISVTADGSQAITETSRVGEAMRQEAEKSKGWWANAMDWVVRNVLTPTWNFIKRIGQDYLNIQSGTSNIGGGADTPYVRWAQGGLITRPMFGLMGEAGPELILPLSDMRRVWELLEESGLLGMLTPDYIESVSGRSSGLDALRIGMSIPAPSSRTEPASPSEMPPPTINNWVFDLDTHTDANAKELVGEFLWGTRVRTR